MPKMSEKLTEKFRNLHEQTLISSPEEGSLSYGAVWANALRIAQDWGQKGLSPGDRVAFVTPNDPAILVSYIACAIGGFVLCPVPSTLNRPFIDGTLEVLKPTLLVEDPPQIDYQVAPPSPNEIEFTIGDHDPFSIVFSSGTTGEPKGIFHSFSTLISSAVAFGRMAKMDVNTRMYHCLPMFYNAGILNTVLAPMMAGGQIIVGPMFSQLSAFNFWQPILAMDANMIVITPTIASSLCRVTRDFDTARAVLAKMCGVHSTSGNLTGALRRRFYKMFGCSLQNCYGLTELGGPLTLQDRECAIKEDNVGFVVPDLEIDLRPLSSGGNQLFIRSPFLMIGYVTAKGLEKPLLDLGFMDTGDTADMIDNRLIITGRIKDVIVRGGINVPTAMIEDEIGKVSGVEEVAVVGVPHEFWGEAMVLCAQVLPGNDEAEMEVKIKNECRERLSQPHRPDFVAVMNSMPRSTVGKVQKNILATEMATILTRDADTFVVKKVGTLNYNNRRHKSGCIND